jgi:hypothetical protein
MINIAKGVISGVVASVLVSGGIYLASAFGLVQPLDPLRAASGIALHPASLGWVTYCILGALLWGTLFAVLSPVLPGLFWFKGAAFGLLAWLLTVAITHVAAASTVTPVALGPIVVHLLFGALLGLTYGALLDESERGGSGGAKTRLGW